MNKILQPKIHIFLYRTTFDDFKHYYETYKKFLNETIIYFRSSSPSKDIFIISTRSELLFGDYARRRPIYFKSRYEFDISLGRASERGNDDFYLQILWNTPDFIGDLEYFDPYSGSILELLRGIMAMDFYGDCFGY